MNFTNVPDLLAWIPPLVLCLVFALGAMAGRSQKR